ncbi:MAG: penicillin-binding transpeptidase domain-containing protein, partial [Candidatus Eremiobacteraeota bacterium]|nr:penicillin-binding transpeptidase domain-containing protein [Candidatus Eremiobacteraeota bacterium]
RQIATLFGALFVILIARQLYMQTIKGPSIAARPYNPRHALLGQHRGRILASDGTVLAETIRKKRVYAFGPSLAQTVGYVSQRYGTSGIEDAYDSALTPPDTTGDVLAQAGEIGQALRGKVADSRGADVVTTINVAIQNELYGRLSEHARGAGVVLDPRTGAVLAMASVPAFDPNGIDKIFSALSVAPHSPLINRATDGLYPPGSTFKIVTAAMALDSGVVTMDSQYSDPGFFTIGNYTVHDDEGEATGTLDLSGAFAKSSNVDFAQIALQIGLDRWYDYAQRWGLGSSLDFQLPAQRDRIPAKADVFAGILAQMGFGQAGLLVSPLRMALVTSTIADNGTEQRPFIVREIHKGASVSAFGPAQLAQPVSTETAQNVQKMMIDVVKAGTGTGAALDGITVAGKTGTATNPAGAAHSWFVCFAPAQAPRVAVAIVVENAGYGAAVALPVARDVLRVALKAVKT